MSRRSRLGKQIVLSTGVVSVITTLIVFVGTFIFYDLMFVFDPPPPASLNSLLPQAPDYLIFAVVALCALIVAVLIALRLSRRILAPLNSLAEGARRIATGDLTARAIPGDRSLGETARMVDDFNSMAMKLEDMVGNMATWNAAIAHELRTPLTILQGRLQGMIDGVFTAEDAQLRNLLLHVEGLSRLVDDLRVVTLQDSGRLNLLLAPTDVSVEVRRAAESMRNVLESAGLEVELTLAPVFLYCDAVRIRQAVLAVLDNARRYARPGYLRIAVHTADERALIRVEDAGPGLSADFAPHAFDPFTRAEASRARVSGGTGLGLSVVRAIAMAHRGDVRYETSPEGGAIFVIELPREM